MMSGRPSSDLKGEIAGIPLHVIERFKQACAQQRDLCDELEAIADSLPDDVDKKLCQRTAENITEIMERTHMFEETELFPQLSHLANDSHHVVQTLNRLKFEHQQDNYFAEEVREALMEFNRGAAGLSADALGYMLRGFFVSLRRHLDMERELVITAVGGYDILEAISMAPEDALH